MHVRLPASLSSCYTIHQPVPDTLFWSLSSSISPGLYPRRSMLSYSTDNSIILHAKTAFDVLAQSASHLCEQITSYRKTDFIFEEERWSRFFFSLIRATRLSSLFDLSFFLVLPPLVLIFLLILLYTMYSRQRLARLRLNDVILFLNYGIAECLFSSIL